MTLPEVVRLSSPLVQQKVHYLKLHSPVLTSNIYCWSKWVAGKWFMSLIRNIIFLLLPLCFLLCQQNRYSCAQEGVKYSSISLIVIKNSTGSFITQILLHNQCLQKQSQSVPVQLLALVYFFVLCCFFFFFFVFTSWFMKLFSILLCMCEKEKQRKAGEYIGWFGSSWCITAGRRKLSLSGPHSLPHCWCFALK